MTGPTPRPARRANGLLALPIGTFAGFAIAFLSVVLIGYGSWKALAERAVAADRVSDSLEIITQIQTVLSTVKDAETGQRGFLLTGAERYLEPYTIALTDLPPSLARLRELTSRNPSQQRRVDAMASLAQEKMIELGETIALRRAGKADEALSVVNSDRGKAAMDRIRVTADDMTRAEQRILARRQTEWKEAVESSALVSGGGSAILLFLIAAAAIAASRDYRAQRTQAWIRNGQLGLSQAIVVEQRLEAQAERALAFLADYLHARVGAIYVADESGGFRRAAGYALDANAASGASHIAAGANLLAQAAQDGRPLHVKDVPEGYLPVSSALGQAASRELLIAPASADGVVQAVIELGFLGRVDAVDQELIARLSETLGLAVRAAKDRLRLQELLEETQLQSEELQTQQEELRVGNEELEEQGRALKESQADARIAAGRARADQPAALDAGRNARAAERCAVRRTGHAQRARRRPRTVEPDQERVPRQHEPTSCARRSTRR